MRLNLAVEPHVGATYDRRKFLSVLHGLVALQRVAPNYSSVRNRLSASHVMSDHAIAFFQPRLVSLASKIVHMAATNLERNDAALNKPE